MFDNAKSHAIFAKNALRVTQMSKGTGGVQPFLCDGWYEKDGTKYTQAMSYSESDNQGQTNQIQKGVQRILEERGL